MPKGNFYKKGGFASVLWGKMAWEDSGSCRDEEANGSEQIQICEETE